jgi:hypothetical protein
LEGQFGQGSLEGVVDEDDGGLSPCMQVRVRAKVWHMEDGYTQLGTVLTDQRPEDSEGDSVIVVGRFKGELYDGVQLSYDAGRRNLYLTPRGGAAPGIPARGGSRKGYRHPVGITGSWLTTEIRLLGPTYGRPDIAPEPSAAR